MLEGLEKGRVFVTGGSGFIGRHLLNSLKKIPGIKLSCLSRGPAPPDWPTGNTWIQSDLADLTPEVWQRHGIQAFDYVFHLAGFIPKKHALADDPERNFKDNVLGTRALLENLPSRPRRFVFASTVDVYSPPEPDRLLSESSTPLPATLYGSSKLFCESFIRAFGKAKDVPFTVLRYGHIYGPGEESFGKLIPESIRKLKWGQALKIHGTGKVLRDYLYVADAVEATLRLSLLEKTQGETINVVRGRSVPIQEVLETLIRVGGFKNPLEYDSSKPDGFSLRFENKKLLGFLDGWRPLELEEGLKRELAQWRED